MQDVLTTLFRHLCVAGCVALKCSRKVFQTYSIVDLLRPRLEISSTFLCPMGRDGEQVSVHLFPVVEDGVPQWDAVFEWHTEHSVEPTVTASARLGSFAAVGRYMWNAEHNRKELAADRVYHTARADPDGHTFSPDWSNKMLRAVLHLMICEMVIDDRFGSLGSTATPPLPMHLQELKHAKHPQTAYVANGVRLMARQREAHKRRKSGIRNVRLPGPPLHRVPLRTGGSAGGLFVSGLAFELFTARAPKGQRKALEDFGNALRSLKLSAADTATLASFGLESVLDMPAIGEAQVTSALENFLSVERALFDQSSRFDGMFSDFLLGRLNLDVEDPVEAPPVWA